MNGRGPDEQLQVDVNYDGGPADWGFIGEARNLKAAMRLVERLRGEGSCERCMAGYRVLDAEGSVVLLLAPINMRIKGARFVGSGAIPETGTV